jgi:hypothetical protein
MKSLPRCLAPFSTTVLQTIPFPFSYEPLYKAREMGEEAKTVSRVPLRQPTT